MCFFGEIGLSGAVRPVIHPGMRLREAGKLGFRQAVVPQSQQIPDDVRGAGVTIRPCADVSGLVAAIARMSTRERTIARGESRAAL